MMDDKDVVQQNDLLMNVPGGIASIAFDDVLTILYATEAFYSLIKNVTEEVRMKAPVALLHIVFSADIIYVTHQLAAQKNRSDNMISLNFRTLQQDGRFRWVMITGTKMEEVYQSGTKTVPVYSCIAMDVTDHMSKYKRLEQILDYHQSISELSKELFFEYEIASDKLSFTELFREVFAKDAEINGLRKKLDKTKLIHPEERSLVVRIFDSMMNGKKQVKFETRLIPKDGKSAWYICYATIIFDENRNPYKVVGKLATTNPLKKEEEITFTKPQLDTLTKVSTRDAAESMMIESMTKQEPDSLSALMLIDIRNYRGINEIMASLNGENILTVIADLMKARFRSTDIVGRRGLSEFVVYVKDIQSDNIVYEQADRLCKEVGSLYSFEHTKSGLAISIGIAFLKGQQQEYSILLANANTALAMAKKLNTSSFEVFYGAGNN